MKEESDAISRWEDNHWTEKHNAPTNRSRLSKMGAIGGSFEYKFLPTSVGTVCSICCNSCMRKIEVELFDKQLSPNSTAYSEMREELLKNMMLSLFLGICKFTYNTVKECLK